MIVVNCSKIAKHKKPLYETTAKQIAVKLD